MTAWEEKLGAIFNEFDTSSIHCFMSVCTKKLSAQG